MSKLSRRPLPEPLPAPPPGYIPLPDYARAIGCDPDIARRAAQQRNVPGAERVRTPGTPQPVWYVPQECSWRPKKRGRPKNPKQGGADHDPGSHYLLGPASSD